MRKEIAGCLALVLFIQLGSIARRLAICMGKKMEKYRDEMIEKISELMRIPSVYQESDKYLFGEPIDKCLDKALEIMKDLGFRTFKAEDGAYGYAEIGEGEMIGVLGHLDVVNARKEDGWDHDPFDPIVKDGHLCGRGSQDDKGAMMAAVYGLKSLLDEGYELKKRVRFIFGLDEETLWRSIAEYTKREEAPAMGFSPDSEFPLTYAEKGLLQVLIKGNEKSVYNYVGGDSFNAVSATAQCAYDEKIEEALKELGFAYHVENDTITATGLTAHARHPWEGVSANLHLIRALEKAGYKDNTISFILDAFEEQYRFEGFADEDLSDFTGPVTVCFSKMQADENGVVLSVDLRLPVSLKKDTVMDLMQKKAEKYGLTVELFDWLAPIHVPLESKLVHALMESYQEVTGDTTSEPTISAGATYARAFDNCVAFGACFPDSVMTEHEPNERASIDELVRASEVFRNAFKKLAIEQ